MLVCPECNSDKLIKYGKKIKERQEVQQYRCSNCHRITTKPRELPDRDNKGRFTKNRKLDRHTSSSSTISARVPTELKERIQILARKRDIHPNEWIKNVLWREAFKHKRGK